MADDISSLFGGAKPKAKAKPKPKAVAKAKATTRSNTFWQGVNAGLSGKPALGKTKDYLDGYIQGSKARKAKGSAVDTPKTKPSAGALTTSKAKSKAKLKPGTEARPNFLKKFLESGVKPSTPNVENASKAFTQGVAAGMKGNPPPTGKTPDWLEGYIQGSKARMATTKAALQRDEKIKAELADLDSHSPVEKGVKQPAPKPLSEPEQTALAARVAKRVEPQSKSLSEPELNKLTAEVASRMEPRHAALSEAQLSIFAAKVVAACNESHKRDELQDAIQDYKQAIDVPKGREPSAEKMMGYRSAIKQKVATLRRGRGGIAR